MKRDIYKIKKQYFELLKSYEKLAGNIEVALKVLLEEAGIGYLAINCRIKSFDSFLKKIDRKHYDNPFVQIEDICGIRVICYYRSDMEKICEVVSREFEVLEGEDKEELLDDNQFGYRSFHYIVKIREDWLAAPNYKGLGNLKAEIQVRTNLMHTWAEIEHKLEYKNDDDIPTKFKRKFSRISAKLEEADEQFEELRREILGYRQELRQNALQDTEGTPEENQINMDTMQVFLDAHFPNHEKSARLANALVKDLKPLHLTIRDLKRFYQEKHEILERIEEEIVENAEGTDGGYRWYQASSAITLLELCCPDYVRQYGVRKGMEEVLKGLI